jgi:type IV pilus assembly protein PilW
MTHMTNFLPSKMSRSPREGGFSLIELMIAMTLGLLILSGLTTIFVKNSLARSEIERSNRQLESGRYAMSLLTEDLRMAGFLATFSPYGTIMFSIVPPNVPKIPAPPLGQDFDPAALAPAMTALPDPCDFSAANLSKSFFFHVQGYDNPNNMPSCVADARAGSDILVIRRVSGCVAGPVNEAGCDAVSPGAPYFQASNCFQATELAQNTGGATAAKDYQAHFRLGTDTSTAFMNRRPINCVAGTQADFRRYLTRIYFVANNNVGSDGIPTLKRAELGAGGFTIVPLVEGIETIQFEYGVDTNGDGPIDGYTTDPFTYNACAGAAVLAGWPSACVMNWLQTHAVKVNLLARNLEASSGYVNNKSYNLGLKADGTANLFPPSGTYGDAYKRHAYNATVRLDNPSGRRAP